MDTKQFFLNPTQTHQRHYEALRAVHVEHLSIKAAAERFHLSAAYLKKLSAQFRQALKRDDTDFFAPKTHGRKPGSTTPPSLAQEIIAMRKHNFSVPDIRSALAAKDIRISLAAIDRLLKQEGFAPLPRRTRQERAQTAAPARIEAPASEPMVWRNESFPTEHGGGPLVFLPLIERLGIVPAIQRAGFPKTSVLSDTASVMSLLALKLLGNERLSHDAPYSLDRALGLFAGLNVLPKNATLSSYSYRVQREQNLALLRELAGIFQSDDSGSDTFNLDFKAIPHWGDQSVLENNWAGMRSKRIKSILALLVQNPDTGMLVYADAGIRHRNENNAVLEFVDFWKEGQNKSPKMLIFDSRFTTYENLSKLNREDIKFLTLRRRGKKLITQTNALPAEHWQTVTIAGRRKHPKVRVHDSLIELRHYQGKVRQIIVTDHGRIHPTFLVTNELDMPIEALIAKYAHRCLVEQEIAEQIDFFHLNSPSSSLVIKVDFDLTLSLLTHNLFRTLTRQLPGFEKCTVATIARDVLQNGANITVENKEITVYLKKKVHLPTLFELQWMKEKTYLPWMDAKIRFGYATVS